MSRGHPKRFLLALYGELVLHKVSLRFHAVFYSLPRSPATKNGRTCE